MFKTTTPILSKADTQKFLKQIDLACKLLDEKFLAEVVQKFELEQWEDTPEFLEDAYEKFYAWRENEKGLQVNQVEEFNTRCIACVFGKKVQGYRIFYSVPGPGGSRTYYQQEFAVNFQLKEEGLTDFGWCNAFLNKQELEDLDDECPF